MLREVNKYKKEHDVEKIDTKTRNECIRGVVHPKVEQMFDGAETAYAMGGDYMISEMLFRLSNHLRKMCYRCGC